MEAATGSSHVTDIAATSATGGRPRKLFIFLLVITLLYNIYQIYSGNFDKMTRALSFSKSPNEKTILTVEQYNALQAQQNHQLEMSQMGLPHPDFNDQGELQMNLAQDDLEMSLKEAESNAISIGAPDDKPKYAPNQNLIPSPDSWFSVFGGGGGKEAPPGGVQPPGVPINPEPVKTEGTGPGGAQPAAGVALPSNPTGGNSPPVVPNPVPSSSITGAGAAAAAGVAPPNGASVQGTGPQDSKPDAKTAAGAAASSSSSAEQKVATNASPGPAVPKVGAPSATNTANAANSNASPQTAGSAAKPEPPKV